MNPTAGQDTGLLTPAAGPVSSVTERDRFAGARSLPVLLFAIVSLALVVALASFPLQQMQETGGLLCYQNAWDEISYLQFDFSVRCLGMLRWGQFLVHGGHLAGLSGGYINLVLDIVCVLGFLALCRCIWLSLGMTVMAASLAAFASLLLPLLFTGGYNPWLHRWFYAVYDSDWLQWVSASHAWYLPLSRSPEPQFSLVLAAACVAVSLRYRSYWPSYACIPFLYPFVMVPYAICVLTLHWGGQPSHSWRRFALAASLSYLLIAAVAGLRILFLNDHLKQAFAITHWPILSTTGILALAIVLLSWPFLEQRMRRPALIVALAPTLANNLQVVNGYFGAPHNFEHNSGTVCCTIVTVLACTRLLAYRPVQALVFAGLGWLAVSFVNFDFTQQKCIAGNLHLTPELAEALRTDPTNVIVPSSVDASLLGMAFPRQAPSAMSLICTYPTMADSYYPKYLAMRGAIVREPEAAKTFADCIKDLDSRYLYENMNFKLLHNLRPHSLHPRHVPELAREVNAEPDLKFFVRGKPWQGNRRSPSSPGAEPASGGTD